MIKIDVGNNIQLTKGNDAAITVNLVENGATYTMGDSDTLTLTVRKSASDSTAVMEVTSTGTNVITISDSDTSSAAPGSYVYDIMLTKANGDKYTVIGGNKERQLEFFIVEGVTR